jgi:hypothetical protein
VPFTTPLLSQARMRPGGDGRLECLLPGFSGGKGVYVVPWAGLPELLPLTLHDRTLYRAVAATEAKTPGAMRTAALEVAARGYAGPEAARRAREALERDQEHATLTQYLIILGLLGESGLAAADLLGEGLRGEEAKRRGKAAIAALASRIGISGDLLFARLEHCGERLSPIGLPHGPEPGRLRRLLGDLDRLRDDVTGWAAGEGTELAGLAGFVDACARHTLGIARSVLAEADAGLRSMRALIADDFALADRLVLSAERLSWLLDGWEHQAGLWARAGREADARREALCEMFRVLPVLPRQEVRPGMEDADPEGMERVQRRWVRAHHDWRSGSVDYGLVRRLESVRALAR